VVEIAGAEYDDDESATIAAGLIDLSWQSDVDADAYALVIYHIDDVERKTPLLKVQTEDEFIQLDLTGFAAGSYQLLIGARVSGTDAVVWNNHIVHLAPVE